jgi:hypothetical protein
MGNFFAFCVALLAATAIGPVIQHLRLHGAQRSYDTSNHNPPAFTFIDLNPTNPLAHFEFDCSRGQVWQVLQCDTLSRKFATQLAHQTNTQQYHIRISLSPEHYLPQHPKIIQQSRSSLMPLNCMRHLTCLEGHIQPISAQKMKDACI